MPIDWTMLAERSPMLAALPRPVRGPARLVEIEAGERLFEQGDPPGAMFFVVGGEIALMRRGRDGAEFVVQRTSFGMLAEASLDQPAYHCEAIARVASRVLAMPRGPFAEALKTGGFGAAWASHLARELRRSRSHAERLSLRTARERIVHYLETEGVGGAAEIRPSLKSWATELGLTHEALYRTLSAMRRTGEVTLEGTRLAFPSRPRGGRAGRSS